MDKRVISVDSFLPQLEDKYNLIHIETDDPSQIYLRGSILSKVDAEQFVKDFSKFTKTQWNVAYEIKTPAKSAFHKLWCCHFSSRFKAKQKQKTEMTYKNLNCLANINIFVKKLTVNTLRTDEYLRLCPPLAAIIKIKVDHSHPIDSVELLRKRRPTEETKAKFFQYFEMGLSIPESRCLHKNLLAEEGVEDFEDSAVNPTVEQVAYFYKLWKVHKDSIGSDSSKKVKSVSDGKSSNLNDVDDPNFCELQDSDIELVDSIESTKAVKRSFRSFEELDKFKKIKAQEELNDGENEHQKDEASLCHNLHKRYDQMDKKSSNASQDAQKNSNCSQKLEQDNELKSSSRTVDPVVTYFVFGPTKRAVSVCEVPHTEAMEAAKTLLTYMESQSDTDLSDIITVRRYFRKIQTKIDHD